MSKGPTFFPTRDAEAHALDLWRAGAEAEDIAAAIWPRGDAPITVDALHNVLRLMDLQDAGLAPSDELPEELKAFEKHVSECMKIAVAEIKADAANANMHKAAQGWAKVALDFSRHRQTTQIHRQQLAALSRAEKAAALARSQPPAAPADPFPSLRQN